MALCVGSRIWASLFRPPIRLIFFIFSFFFFSARLWETRPPVFALNTYENGRRKKKKKREGASVSNHFPFFLSFCAEMRGTAVCSNSDRSFSSPSEGEECVGRSGSRRQKATTACKYLQKRKEEKERKEMEDSWEEGV